jgi:hypothetical protein
MQLSAVMWLRRCRGSNRSSDGLPSLDRRGAASLSLQTGFGRCVCFNGQGGASSHELKKPREIGTSIRKHGLPTDYSF